MSKSNNCVTPKVQLVWSTPDPQRIVAVAARICYSAMPVSELLSNLDQPEIDRMVSHVMEARHYSVLRQVLFMFTIEGVSRSFSHQFVRHHAGFDVEQRSQHYRREKQFGYVVPPRMSAESKKKYAQHMACCQKLYDTLVNSGLDKAEARQVLPNACETQLVCTLNLNALVNFLGQRLCRVNTQEITAVAQQMRKLVLQKIPEALRFLGPKCWTDGICYEGMARYIKSCGRPWRNPSVMWTPEFPEKIVLVGPAGKVKEISNGKK